MSHTATRGSCAKAARATRLEDGLISYLPRPWYFPAMPAEEGRAKYYPNALSLLLVLKEVDGVLLHVLPPVVVAHDGLRVLVLRHHLHLPVSEARV